MMKPVVLTILLLVLIFSPGFLATSFAMDAYEEDDTYSQASIIVINDETAQPHDLHSSNDKDWIIFYGIEDTPYQVEVINPGSGIDPYIILYDEDGASVLDSGDDYGPGENETLLWTCPKDGTYFAQIGHNNSSPYGDATEYDLELINAVIFYLPGYLTGYIVSRSSAPVSGALIKATNRSSGFQGSAISQSNGSFIVSHEEGSYTITVSAAGYGSASATGSIPGTLNFTLNTIPVAAADFTKTTRGGTVSGNVLANDKDGDGDPLVSVLDTDVAHGNLNLNRNGEFTYTHNGDEYKIDSFTYHVSDGRSNSNVVRVTIVIDQVYLPFLMLLKDSK